MAKIRGGGGGATSPAVTGSAAASSIQVSSVYGNEEVMIEIMSRLPIKSLMRFKCLSRRWFYLIQQDKHLISLHFSRSKSSQMLFITSRSRYSSGFFTLDLSKRSIEQMAITPKSCDSVPMFIFVNGLLCFVNQDNHSVCIRNVCTREETPWIRPNITESYYNTFGFGFDPVTQKHKIVFVCRPYNKCYDHQELNCEVLTVGENHWRTKEDVALPMHVVKREAFYSNGSLYWCVERSHYPSPDRESMDCILVVFDVGKEEFRVIKYPDIVKDPNGFVGKNNYIDVLLQGLDGLLVLIDRWYYDSENKVLKMRIWMIDDDKEKNTSNWIGEETIYLPINGGKFAEWSFASITNFLVITVQVNGGYSGWHREIHLYDLKKKKVIQFRRLLGLSPFNEFFLSPYQPKLSVYRSSIFPVCG